MGLIYVTLPLNLFIYGWNDIVDYDIDQLNPRKGNYLFGSKLSKKDLSILPVIIIITQIPFLAYFLYTDSSKMLLIFAGLFLVNLLYNLPEKGLRGRPPYELFNQAGFLLIFPFSSWLNGFDVLSPATFIYTFLFALQGHFAGEIMDIVPDKKGGRKTTAVLLGFQKSKFLLAAITLIESLLLVFIFEDIILGAALALFTAWILLDALIIFKHAPYSVTQMKYFGVLVNVFAYASMVWVYINGSFI